MSYILVVDVDANFRKFMALTLKRKGYAVSEACTAEDVLEQMRHELPLAMVLNVWLIDMSGWELLQTLKDDERLAAVPVVLMTSTPSQENADAKLKYENIATQITKPMSISRLVTAVEKAVHQSKHPAR